MKELQFRFRLTDKEKTILFGYGEDMKAARETLHPELTAGKGISFIPYNEVKTNKTLTIEGTVEKTRA